MDQVDEELKRRLESLGQGVAAGLGHIQDLINAKVAEIKEAAPRTVMVRSLPRDWICARCNTGMLSSRKSVFVHVCESEGVFFDG